MDIQYLCGKTVNIFDDIFSRVELPEYLSMYICMYVCRYWNLFMDIDEDPLTLIHTRNEQYDITVVHVDIPTICSL